jgi:signal recognition particle receptor subunit beta
MVTVKTQGDRTLFFDFFPFDMGKISGYDVKIQLYTVPGQVKYNSTRRLVLKGVDGVVFVADSAADRRNKNIISIKNLEENLKLYNKNIRDIPLVIQYNKRDLAKEGIEILDVETLENDLNSELKVPSFEASAVEGNNVIPTLKKIIYDTMSSLEKQLKQEP